MSIQNPAKHGSLFWFIATTCIHDCHLHLLWHVHQLLIVWKYFGGGGRRLGEMWVLNVAEFTDVMEMLIKLVCLILISIKCFKEFKEYKLKECKQKF